MLDFFKPYILKDHAQNPVDFDQLGHHHHELLENHHDKNISLPVIFAYDGDSETYFYLKMSASKNNRQDNPYLVEFTSNNQPMVIDCSHIFEIEKSLLESLVVANDSYGVFDDNLQYQLLTTINLACNEVPPNLAIVDVYEGHKHHLQAQSVYLSAQKIVLLNEDNFWYGNNIDSSQYLSNPNSSDDNQVLRYDIAIQFVQLFQAHYFQEQFDHTDYQTKYYGEADPA